MIGITLPNRQGFDDLVFSHPKMIFGKHIHMFASIEIDLLFTFFLYASIRFHWPVTSGRWDVGSRGCAFAKWWSGPWPSQVFRVPSPPLALVWWPGIAVDYPKGMPVNQIWDASKSARKSNNAMRHDRGQRFSWVLCDILWWFLWDLWVDYNIDR